MTEKDVIENDFFCKLRAKFDEIEVRRTQKTGNKYLNECIILIDDSKIE